MRAQRRPSYADSMGASVRDERAALIALLQTRPEGLRWAEITAEVLESASALEVWRRLVPATLVEAPGRPDALESAAQDLDLWASQGSRLVTILDGDYPVRLRGIHQAPPILFARGSLIRDD
jgi:DNA processing protein